jgi:hypothetical protein
MVLKVGLKLIRIIMKQFVILSTLIMGLGVCACNKKQATCAAYAKETKVKRVGSNS